MGVLVAGLDGFKSKWVAVVLEEGVFREALLFACLGDACSHLAGASVLAADVPMGLPIGKVGRRAEDEARGFLGGDRASSVFPTYPREVYEAETREAASRIAQPLGKGIGSTAFALRRKILEACAVADPRLIEVHPEVSFAEMSHGPLRYGKRTWNGQGERRQLLLDLGILVPCVLEGSEAGEAGPDDVLDAAAAAWTAWRKARGVARHFPNVAPSDGEGVIWY